jgi:hypothetical protein
MKVQSKPCKTCIYKQDLGWRLDRLEAQIADPNMQGFFVGWRICHLTQDVCCRGFWNRHKNHFQLGQLAQRLKFVEFV